MAPVYSFLYNVSNMSYIIVGLGNPGEEYESTRHNTGRIILEVCRKKFEGSEWKLDKKSNALVSGAKIGKAKVLLVMPEGMMNNSGKSLKPLITSVKKTEELVVIHDDIDLPLGRLKIIFDRGSGGHRGIDSIIKNLKTQKFGRIKVGIAATTPKGKAKKPKDEAGIIKLILGKFKDPELVQIKKEAKKIAEALEVMVNESREKAMTLFNNN